MDAAPQTASPWGFLDPLYVLLTRWRLVLGIPAAAVVVVAAVSLVLPAYYTASSTFYPEVKSIGQLPSGLAGLAGQFGVSLDASGSQGSRFYADLALSREVLERVLASRYAVRSCPPAAPDSCTLLQVLYPSRPANAATMERAVKKLRRLLNVDFDAKTSIVIVSVRTREPALSAAVANRLVAIINEFNNQSRQTQARARRVFVEQRLASGEHDLRSAEEELRHFYDVNRTWQQSPQLMFEEGRLRRQVEVVQEVYLTLRREYESARIEEVNDTPLLTVIDRAIAPDKRSSPRRAVLVLVAAVLGFFSGIIAAFTREAVVRVRTDDPLRSAALGDAFRDLRGGLSRLVPRRRRPRAR